MAGILDFLQSPDAQLGIGLLAAGGPTTDPNQTGFGQRLSGAMQNMRASQMAQAQLAEMQQKAALQSVLLQNELNWQNMTGFGQPPRAPQGSGVPLSAPLSGGGAVSGGGGAPVSASSGAPASVDGSAPQAGGGFRFPYVLPGKTPEESAAIAASQGRQAFMKLYAEQTAPQTDAEKLAFAMGYRRGTPEFQQVVQGAIGKATTVPLRPGAPYIDATGIHGTPAAAAPGYINLPNPNDPSGWSSVPVGGGLQAQTNSTEAHERGKGNIETKPVWDQTANNGQGGYVNQTLSNISDAANGKSAGNAPLGVRNNNPGNLRPVGASAGFQQFATPEEGIAALEADLNAKAAPGRGIDTLRKLFGGTPDGKFPGYAPAGDKNNPDQYATTVGQRLGISPDQKIDLSNPYLRHAVASQIMLQENGPTIFVGQTPAKQGGPMLSQPPLGQTANADKAQEASAQTMRDSYAKLKGASDSANSALDAIDKMQKLAAAKNGLLTVGPLGTMQAPVNPDAAEYEKQRANLITQLSAQNGTNGTDAGRALTGESVPDFGKPKTAIADGLQTLRNQTVAQQLKANLLTPAYQAGDSKTYTKLENEFNQNVSPSMVPILTMPAGPDRAAEIKKVLLQPGMKAKLNWAVENGLLK